MDFKIYENLLNFLYDDCLYCGESCGKRNSLCDKCYDKLDRFHGCIICPLNEICMCEVKNFIPVFYNDISRDLILKFKYKDCDFLCEFLSNLIFNETEIGDFCNSETVFVSVPMNSKRLIQREYNQSVLLCKVLQKKFNAKINNFVFAKKKNFNQKGKSSEERQKNVQNIVINNIEGIIGKNVCIVDDVIASGSTIKRCASLLKPYAKRVFIAAIAKS